MKYLRILSWTPIRSAACVAACYVGLSQAAVAQAVDAPSDTFNSYILKAVDYLSAHYSAEGYGQSAFTHNLSYGSVTVAAGPKAPQTMCVAAVAEVIVTALNLYMEQTKDTTPQTYLPSEGWSRLRPKDIKSHIWVDSHLQSWGTADALSTFGIGRHQSFSQLQPGSFINLNRTNHSGHAVVFLSYLDAKGNELASYGKNVAGFKYFSSQGKTGAPGSGFGFKYAFFNANGSAYCPKLGEGKRVDCGIIYSFSPKYLNTGYMLMPAKWDIGYRDRSIKQLAENLYQQNYSRSVAIFPGVPRNASRDQFRDFIETHDVMTLNSLYASEVMPDDVGR